MAATVSRKALAGADWRKSSHSGNGGPSCVEVAPVHPVIAVRDSKHPAGDVLFFDRRTWAAFTERVKRT